MTDGHTWEGGPGWHIDRQSLLPKITDVDVFRAAHADDDAIDILVALWTGQPRAAEVELRRRIAQSDSPRLRALLADAERDQGRTDEAIAAYQSLVRQSVGTSSEAVMNQHLGKAYFVARRYRQAASAFERALELRMQQRAADDLITSSRVAADRAREEASRT